LVCSLGCYNPETAGKAEIGGQPAVLADSWLIRTGKRMMEGFPTYGVDTGRHGAWAS